MTGYKRVNFYDLCRLCATHQHREKTHIFQEKGRKIQLQDKIQSCLSLQVCETDCLPKVVCSTCLESLEKSCIFRQECYNSETMLVSYFNNFRHTEEFKRSGKVYIKDVSQKSVGTEVEGDLTLPPVVTMATASTNTECTVNLVPNIVPQEVLSSFYTLQIPQVSSIATTPVIQQAPPVVTSTPLIQQVQENHKLVQQPQVLYNHKTIPNFIKNNIAGTISIRVNSNGEIISTAPIVDVNSYITQQKYIQHRKIPDNPIVKIDLTDDSEAPITSNQPVIYNHIQQNFNRATNMNVVSVPYDSVVINSQVHEDSLPSTPSPPYNSNSSHLPDAFIPSSSSQSTLDVFEPSSPVKSTACNTSQQDESINEKPRSFACSVCSKGFRKREHLYQHVKLHSGFRPYKCQHCNKSYIRKEHLMRHLTSHNGEKKFSCEICKRSFSRHDNLLKHKKIHEKLNYTCEVCQRKFMVEHFFLAHKSTHEVKCSILGIS